MIRLGTKFPLVVVESPFAGDQGRNIRYARACVRHSLSIGESPIASHLLLAQPGILDDSIPSERNLGMSAGRAWIPVCNKVAFYIDFGMSPGMKQALANCSHRISFRKLPEACRPAGVAVLIMIVLG